MQYINEHDTFAAAWLRALIDAGELPEAVVDERDIRDVKGTDLEGYSQCHWFGGIAGWPLALRLAGWPAEREVWSGSCPCQPFSAAGKHQGFDDERHLWPEFRRLIAECRPPVVFGEQVASKLGREWLAGVRADMEALGYAVGAADLCAAGVSAPHMRQRLFWVADAGHDVLSRARQGRGVEASERCQSSIDIEPNSVAGWPRAAWVRCNCCDEFWCRIHGQHAFECECPEIDEWGDVDPYADGLADAANLRRAEHEREPGRRDLPGPHYSAVGSGVGGMGEPIQQGLEGHSRNEDDGHQPGRIGAGPTGPATAAGHARPWDSYRAIPCRDGKSRRTPAESILQPLAYGVPNRVGILRGAGNAIVPQVAAAFIKAFLDTEA